MLSADAEAKPLGGGTAIQILRKQGLLSPSTLVDLDGVAELKGIGAEDGFLRIGAMVTHREVERSAEVRASAPLLCETYRRVSNVRVRHTATVGGNLAHGDYRLDPPAALLVLGGEIVAAGPDGRRVISMDQFFVDLLETALAPGELIVEIRVPLSHPRRSTEFVKFSSLAANDWPCVGVAVSLEWDADERVMAASLGISAMGPTPLLIRLDKVGGATESTVAEAAVEAALAAVDPIPDLRGSASYKRRVCGTVVGDAIAGAWQKPKEGERA